MAHSRFRLKKKHLFCLRSSIVESFGVISGLQLTPAFAPTCVVCLSQSSSTTGTMIYACYGQMVCPDPTTCLML